MEIMIFFGLILLLLIGVGVSIWLRRVNRLNLEKTEYKTTPFLTSYSDARKVAFIAGVSSIALAAHYFFSEQPQSNSGRWSWLFYSIYKLAGNEGISLLFLFVGIALIVCVLYPLNSDN